MIPIPYSGGVRVESDLRLENQELEGGISLGIGYGFSDASGHAKSLPYHGLEQIKLSESLASAFGTSFALGLGLGIDEESSVSGGAGVSIGGGYGYGKGATIATDEYDFSRRRSVSRDHSARYG